jgi:hypothetical protein
VLTDGDRRFPEPLGRWQRVLVILRLRRDFEQSRRFHFRTPVSWIVDSVDERRALRLRTRFGQRRWLVSWEWQPEAPGAERGRWRARLSCPSLVFTLERTGKTRTEAIESAARALVQLLALRQLLHRDSLGLTDDLESTDDPFDPQW